MRTLTLSLALGLLIATVSPAFADGECSWGHARTADAKNSSVAESHPPQTPKPDRGG